MLHVFKEELLEVVQHVGFYKDIFVMFIGRALPTVASGIPEARETARTLSVPSNELRYQRALPPLHPLNVS